MAPGVSVTKNIFFKHFHQKFWKTFPREVPAQIGPIQPAGPGISLWGQTYPGSNPSSATSLPTGHNVTKLFTTVIYESS